MSAAEEYLEDESASKTALDRAYLGHYIKKLRLIHSLRFGRRRGYAYYKYQGAQYRAMIARKYPKGMPMASRPGPWRCIVDTSDIVLILRCNKRTAQRKMKFMREDMGKGKGRYVTVKEFCKYEFLPEDYIQNFLNGVSLQDSYERGLKLYGTRYMNQENEDTTRRIEKELERIRKKEEEDIDDDEEDDDDIDEDDD